MKKKRNSSFRCKRCGYCCALRVKLNLYDILRLRLAGFKLKDYAEKNMMGNYCIKMLGKDCYFLRRKNKKTYCIAYAYRPKVCRIYPFIREDIKNCDELKRLKHQQRI